MSLSISSYYRSNFFLAFSITILCFLTTYFIFGFYYIDYQPFASALFSGKLTPGVPFRSLYFIVNYGISYLYTGMYLMFPNVEWLSWIYSAYSFFAAFIGLYLTASLLPYKTSLIRKSILLFALFFLVFAGQNIHFLCTLVSYMSCGLSLVALILLFNAPGAIKSRMGLFVSLNLFFLLGALIRVESATATLALTIFFAALYLKDIKQCIRLFSFPLILITSISLIISWDIKNSTEFYKQIEPDIEAQFQNRGNAAPLAYMKTHRDTVLYKTAMDIVWSDPKIITPEYLRSLIMPEKLLFTDFRQWQRVFSNILEVIRKYWYLVLINSLLVLSLFFQFTFKKNDYTWLYWLAFELSFWVLLCLQTYAFKLNDRSFSPYMSLFILFHIVILLSSMRLRISPWLYIILPFVSILFFVHLYYLNAEANVLKEDLVRYQRNFETIQKVAANKYLVLNSSSSDYICMGDVPFHPFDFSAFKRIYVTDGSVIPFIPDYKRYLEKECKCNIYAYPSFYNYLRSIHNQVVIVSAPGRLEIIKNYLQEIHQYNLPICEDSSITLSTVEKAENRGSFDNLKVYSLGE